MKLECSSLPAELPVADLNTLPRDKPQPADWDSALSFGWVGVGRKTPKEEMRFLPHEALPCDEQETNGQHKHGFEIAPLFDVKRKTLVSEKERIRLQRIAFVSPAVEPKVAPKRKIHFSHTVMLLGCLGALGMAAWGGMMLASGNPDREVSIVEADQLDKQVRTAEQVARAFISETDVEKRLAYVRDAEVVRTRLDRYAVEARNHPVVELKEMGHSVVDGRPVSAYAARFDNGNYRMLCVVDTDEGAKVDWDSYARYSSATWDEMFSGAVTEAEVRVFVRPGDYQVGQFRDPSRWTCFLIQTPDCERSIYAYARAGSDMAQRMQAMVLSSKNFRQHMTLKLKSHNESHKEGLFVVDDLLAMGWVK